MIPLHEMSREQILEEIQTAQKSTVDKYDLWTRAPFPVRGLSGVDPEYEKLDRYMGLIRELWHRDQTYVAEGEDAAKKLKITMEIIADRGDSERVVDKMVIEEPRDTLLGPGLNVALYRAGDMDSLYDSLMKKIGFRSMMSLSDRIMAEMERRADAWDPTHHEDHLYERVEVVYGESSVFVTLESDSDESPHWPVETYIRLVAQEAKSRNDAIAFGRFFLASDQDPVDYPRIRR